jgi:hypothetical protein
VKKRLRLTMIAVVVTIGLAGWLVWTRHPDEPAYQGKPAVVSFLDQTCKYDRDGEVCAQKATQERPDALGCVYHTFRIEAASSKLAAGALVSSLVAAGWHLLGGPLRVPAASEIPKHIFISMIRHQPRPVNVRGDLRDLRFGGEFRGQIVLEL